MNTSACHCWGVVTSNREKANKVFDEVEKEYERSILRKIVSPNNRETIFQDGHRLIWARPNVRGRRYNRIWIDKDIVDEEILHCVVYPQLLCSKKDITWI